MSSGTRVDPYGAKRVQEEVSQRLNDKVRRLGLSPRQQVLNELWAHYRCMFYDARSVEWDGSKRQVGVEREAIATCGFIPPGFYDAGGKMLPLRFRRPSAPYALPKVIVDRFTGLLFSERRNPRLRCPGDPDTEDYVQALAEAGRLWPAMMLARTYGGALGSVAVGFQVYDGKPMFEVHDPRWLIPDFEDMFSLKLRSIEKRYQFPKEERDETGAWVEQPYWYRRVIDEHADTLYTPVLVPEDGSEPEWTIQRRVEHELGFCPVVWIQNQPVQDAIDGDSDCHGIFDMVEQIDALIAQGNRGTITNADPTVVITTPDEMPSVTTGSSSAVKISQGDVKFLEITGTGPKAAFDAADKLRAYALEVAQCVLDHPDSAQRTATEVDRVYSSMLAKADVLREQYGQRGVLAVLEIALNVARKIGTASADAGAVQRGSILLPDRVLPQPDGAPPKMTPRKLGNGTNIQVQWGAYFAPSLQDTVAATTAAASAKQASLIDAEHASSFVAEHYHVEDVGQMLTKIGQEAEVAQQQMEDQMMADIGNRGKAGSDDPEDVGEGA